MTTSKNLNVSRMILKDQFIPLCQKNWFPFSRNCAFQAKISFQWVVAGY